MPNTVNARVIEEGGKNVVLHVYIESDGSGDLVNEVVFDPAGRRLAIEKVWSSLAGFDVLIAFDSIPDSPVWVCTDGTHPDVCFMNIGGLKDPGGLDASGKVVFTTTGMSVLGDKGVIILKMRKGNEL